jgi:hypothetical protein
MRIRRIVLAVLLLIAAARLDALNERIGPWKVVVGRYTLQSNRWVNLHQRLMQEAMYGDPPPSALSGAEMERWKGFVDRYRLFVARRDPIHNAELIALNRALSDSPDELPAAVPEAAAAVLRDAMPLYEPQWVIDDRVNRFWIAAARPLLESAGEELATAHEDVYPRPFPTEIRVDVSPLAGEYGAYTVGEGAVAHTVMSSTDPGYKEFFALEMLFHEPSHAIVGPNSRDAVGEDLARGQRETGLRAPPGLWHAILFYTSGELTRRALARRGISDYQPFIIGMYERAYSRFRASLEKHWQDYLDGEATRAEAIREIVLATGTKE